MIKQSQYIVKKERNTMMKLAMAMMGLLVMGLIAGCGPNQTAEEAASGANRTEAVDPNEMEDAAQGAATPEATVTPRGQVRSIETRAVEITELQRNAPTAADRMGEAVVATPSHITVSARAWLDPENPRQIKHGLRVINRITRPVIAEMTGLEMEVTVEGYEPPARATSKFRQRLELLPAEQRLVELGDAPLQMGELLARGETLELTLRGAATFLNPEGELFEERFGSRVTLDPSKPGLAE